MIDISLKYTRACSKLPAFLWHNLPDDIKLGSYFRFDSRVGLVVPNFGDYIINDPHIVYGDHWLSPSKHVFLIIKDNVTPFYTTTPIFSIEQFQYHCLHKFDNLQDLQEDFGVFSLKQLTRFDGTIGGLSIIDTLEQLWLLYTTHLFGITTGVGGKKE